MKTLCKQDILDEMQRRDTFDAALTAFADTLRNESLANTCRVYADRSKAITKDFSYVAGKIK